MPRDELRPAVRLVDLERAGRQVDEQFGPRRRQFGHRIAPAFGGKVIGRSRFAEPGVFADMHTQPQAAKFQRRRRLGRKEIATFVEDVVIGEQALVDRLLDAARPEQAGGIADASFGQISHRRMADEHAEARGDCLPRALDRPVAGGGESFAQQQVFGRVAADEQLRDDEQFGPGSESPFGGSPDEAGVSRRGRRRSG